MPRCSLNKNGFTLIEVMVALVVVSLGLLGVAAMQGIAIQGNAFAKDVTIATNVNQAILERIRLHATHRTLLSPYDGIDTTVISTRPLTDPGRADYIAWQQQIAALRLPNGRGTITVQYDQPAPGMSTITSRVSWKTGERPNGQIVTSTIVDH